MGAVELNIEPDKASWHSLERALRDAADGRELLNDLERSWRAAATIAANDAKRSARMISAPRSRHAVSLRSAIASGVGVDTDMGAGKVNRGGGVSKPSKSTLASVAITWRRSGMKKARRGRKKRAESILWRAGWLANKGHPGWSHPVFGLGPNVTTNLAGKGWFDDSIEPHKPGFVLAVRQAYGELVDAIERQAHR
jgi:hypothetical protein